MAKKKGKSKQGYFGISWIVSIILAIIPITNIIFGIVTRLQRNKIILAILNFFLCPIFYIIDILSMIINKKISWLA